MSEWRTIPSAPGYEASSNGDIRNRTTRRLIAKFLNRQRRARVGIKTLNGQRKCLVSRLVCEAFYGPCPSENHQVAHYDGDRMNDKADNLRWATRKENYEDQIRHGTSKRGEGHHIAKLNDHAVREIRSRAPFVMQKQLAEEFGVSSSVICQVISRQIWPHVK